MPLHPIPRTWADWKHEASVLNNQWNATCPQALTKNSATPSPPTPTSATNLHSTHTPLKWQDGHQPTAYGPRSCKVQEQSPGLLHTTATDQGTSPTTAQSLAHIECRTWTTSLGDPLSDHGDHKSHHQREYCVRTRGC